MYKNYLTLMFH
jgi:hypothetical protein